MDAYGAPPGGCVMLTLQTFLRNCSNRQTSPSHGNKRVKGNKPAAPLMEKLISFLKNLHVSDRKMVGKISVVVPTTNRSDRQTSARPSYSINLWKARRRGSPREGLLHIEQLKIRYGVHVFVHVLVHAHVLVHVLASLRLTARVPKWVFDPSTAGIFTQEIGKDASELLFMERRWFSPLWEGKKKKKNGDKNVVNRLSG